MNELENIKKLFEEEIVKVSNLNELNDVRNNYLGKNGHLTTVMKIIKDLSVEEKKSFGGNRQRNGRAFNRKDQGGKRRSGDRRASGGRREKSSQ